MADISKLSNDELLAMLEKNRSSIAGDMAKSLGTGTVEGAIGIAGLPGDALKLGENAVGYVKPKDPGPDAVGKVPSSDKSLIPTSPEIKERVEQRFGKLYEPQGMAGEYSRTFGQMLPAAAFPGSAATRVGNVVLPALASESAGQLFKGQPQEAFMRVAGALLGVPAVAGRAVTPLPASAERNRLVGILNDEGVTSLTAGQRSGSKPLQWFEQTMSDLPFAGKGARRITDEGKEQFTTATLRRVGEQGTRADDVTMNNAFERIGQQFDDLASRNNIQADQRLYNDLGDVLRHYRDVVAPNSQVPVVNNTLSDIVQTVRQQNGQISGAQYSDFRTRLNKIARNTNDGQLSDTLFGIQRSLDDAMERSIPGGSPDAALWRQTRREYRNIIPLEKAVTGAGAETAEGLVSPSQLRNAVVNENRRAYARGEGDYAELARAGEGVMRELPNSGTAPRSFMQSLTTGAGLTATGGIPIGAGRVVTSGPVQSYLGNQLLAPALRGTSPKRDALVQLLLSEPRLQLSAPTP